MDTRGFRCPSQDGRCLLRVRPPGLGGLERLQGLTYPLLTTMVQFPLFGLGRQALAPLPLPAGEEFRDTLGSQLGLTQLSFVQCGVDSRWR